eukprot:scaffold10733_cov72-Phaeocystis_antarctica.AAC.3
MPATANERPTAGVSMRLTDMSSARSHSHSCTARHAACPAASADEQAVSNETHGPCSPSTKDSRPAAMEWLLPVAAYTLRPDGLALSTSAKSFAAMPRNTPVALPMSSARHSPAAWSASHAEAPVVEALGAAHERAVPHAQRHRARRLRKRLEFPSLRRHLADGVGARSRHAPGNASAVGATRQHGTHPNEHHVPPGCSGSGLRASRWRRRREKRGQASQQSLARRRGCGRRGGSRRKCRNVCLQLAHGGVVEDQRLGQCRFGVAAQPLRQPAAQLHRAQRVEPRLHQRRVGANVSADHLGDHRAHRITICWHTGRRRARHRIQRRTLEHRRQLHEQRAIRRRCRGGLRRLHERGNVRLQLAHGGVVEDQRLGQCRLGVAAQPLRQPAAQLHRAQRVEPRLQQRRIGAHIPADQLGDHRAHRDASVGHKQRRRTLVAGWLHGGRELRWCRCGRRALCDGVHLRDEPRRAERERRELDKLVSAPA